MRPIWYGQMWKLITLMIRDSIHWMVNIVQVPDSPIGIECSSTMFTKSSDPPFSG